MMRELVLGALVGSLLLLAPSLARAAPPAAPGLSDMAPVSYVQGPLDNPSEPGDAFPAGPFAGGTG